MNEQRVVLRWVREKGNRSMLSICSASQRAGNDFENQCKNREECNNFQAGFFYTGLSRSVGLFLGWVAYRCVGAGRLNLQRGEMWVILLLGCFLSTCVNKRRFFFLWQWIATLVIIFCHHVRTSSLFIAIRPQFDSCISMQNRTRCREKKLS